MQKIYLLLQNCQIGFQINGKDNQVTLQEFLENPEKLKEAFESKANF
jgi:hypothetical protein